MNIRGTEGLTPADIQAEIARGARFVAYQWCISLLVITLKRGTRIYYLKPGETGFLPGFCWSAFTLIAGWWGFPWGPIYTIGSLWTNLRGGIDVTAAVSTDLTATHGAPAVAPLSGALVPAPRWSAGPLAALGLLAAAIGGTIFGVQYHERQHMPVALANGLGASYTAEIDGVRHELRPHSVQRLELPEGQHTVAASLPGGTGETRFTFDTSEVSGAKITVINPDAAALVDEETMIYTPKSLTRSKAEPLKPNIYSGRTAYTLAKPDYFLADFPEHIEMPSDSNEAYRCRITVLTEFTPGQAADIVLRYTGRSAMVAYLQELGKRQPNNQELLQTAVQLLEPTEAKAFFATHLAARPVYIEWHRTYQSYIQFRQPEIDVATEYRHLAETEPDEGAFAYLYGRILDDPSIARSWFERALAAKKPSAYAHAALAYDIAAAGDFVGALAALEQARAAGLDTTSQREQRIECLVALHRLDEALREFKALPPPSAADFARATQEIHLNYLAGGTPAAKHAIDAFVARLPSDISEDSRKSIRKTYEAQLAYYEGDQATYVANTTAEAGDIMQMIAALCRDDRAGAEKALAALPVQTSGSWLMLYISAKLGHDPRADSYWDKAIAAFAREPYGHRRLAAHFTGTAALPTSELIDYPMTIPEKRIFLAAIGLHEPRLRAAAFARAQQCNFSREFPYHLVAAALATAKP
jgi:hypothetical protein